MHKVFPSSLKTGMMQQSEWSQIGILQKPQNMLSIKPGTSIPIWLHAVRMVHANYGINKVNSLFSMDILVNTKTELLIEKHREKSWCNGFLQKQVKTANAQGHPTVSDSFKGDKIASLARLCSKS